MQKPDPDFDAISRSVQCDLGLAYKLLRLVNSVYYGPVHGIRTIRHALTHLGLSEMRKWFSILMLKDLQTADSSELIKLSLTRGKLMELLAEELQDEANKPDYFFTGAFSFINVLLGRSMGEILSGLPISDKIKRALLGEDNEYRKLLDFVAASEQMNWDGKVSQRILSQNRREALYGAVRAVAEMDQPAGPLSAPPVSFPAIEQTIKRRMSRQALPSARRSILSASSSALRAIFSSSMPVSRPPRTTTLPFTTTYFAGRGVPDRAQQVCRVPVRARQFQRVHIE